MVHIALSYIVKKAKKTVFLLYLYLLIHSEINVANNIRNET